MIEGAAALLERAVAAGDPPAASACAFLDGELVHRSAHGASPDGAAASIDSVFDVASITKVAATTLAVAVLVARGALSLDRAVAEVLPAFAARGKGAVTVRELLGHRSGLPAWRPFFMDVLRDPALGGIFDRGVDPDPARLDAARARVLAQVFDSALGPPGAVVYSDLGFLALGALVEQIAGCGLDRFVEREVFAPLALADLGFADLRVRPGWLAARHVLPTGRTRPREGAPGQEALVVVPPQRAQPDAGRVDDDNAFAMGGVAGHAGLFGTATAVAALGARVLDALRGDDPLRAGPVLAELARPDRGGPRGLGFDRAELGSSAGSSVGRGARGAIGHLGFTGCSLWIDLDRRLSVALLTNRSYPGRHRVEGIRALRPAFHDAIWQGLE